MKYVVDTCIFNKLADAVLLSTDLPSDGQLVVTHVQIDELNKTTDSERKRHLLSIFEEIAPEQIATEYIVWDVSRWDHAKWSDGANFKALRASLDALNGGKSNNVNDVLIAEVALVNSYTLLTSDYDLYQAAKEHGVSVRYFRGRPPSTPDCV